VQLPTETSKSVEILMISILFPHDLNFLTDYSLKQLQKIVQPYVVSECGFNIPLSRATKSGIDTNRDGIPDISLKSLGYPGGLVSGITPESPEFYGQRLPIGYENIRLTYSIGGDVDLKLTERIFVGTDLRYNILEGGGDSATFTSKGGFLWEV